MGQTASNDREDRRIILRHGCRPAGWTKTFLEVSLERTCENSGQS
jgi:hypothetical protein